MARALSIGLILASVGLVACQTPTTHQGGRSLVFVSPRLHRLTQQAQAQQPPDSLPWYAGRKDLRLSVLSGYRTATYERVYSITEDRQYQTNRGVHDSYSQRTYRASISEAVR